MFTWGDLKYVFGPDCYVEQVKDDEVVKKRFARNVWPRQIYEHVDDQEFGVRFEYVTQTGEWAHGLMSGSAFVDKASGRRACADASAEGVDVAAGSEYHLAYALGRWREATKDVEIVKMTKSSGWKKRGRIYVNGMSVFGDSEWYADDTKIAIRRRSQRRGTLEDWIKAVKEEVVTPGLRAPIGVSLAGPLVHPMNLHPFILNIYGNSSCGKSTAGCVAASPWSSPVEKDNGLFQSWSATMGGFELLCASADGACLVLDELGKFKGNSKDLADLVHMITAKSGVVSMTRNRDERESMSWAITGVSTGEVSMKASVGDYLQGGQMVRMVDLDVNPGEVTTDAAHSDRVRRRFSEAYGHAGDAWIEYLVGLGKKLPMFVEEQIAHWRNKLKKKHDDGTPEGGRILSHVYLIGAAIGLARNAGLIPWPQEEDEDTLDWLAGRIMEDRDGSKTPNERALERWLEMIDTQPSRFPFENETKTSHEVFGFTKKTDNRYEVWTSESFVKASGMPQKSGVTPRKWLRWCVDNGHCSDRDDEWCANKQRKWKVFVVGHDKPQGQEEPEDWDDGAPF